MKMKRGKMAAELLWVWRLSRHAVENKNATCEFAAKSPDEEEKEPLPHPCSGTRCYPLEDSLKMIN